MALMNIFHAMWIDVMNQARACFEEKSPWEFVALACYTDVANKQLTIRNTRCRQTRGSLWCYISGGPGGAPAKTPLPKAATGGCSTDGDAVAAATAAATIEIATTPLAAAMPATPLAAADAEPTLLHQLLDTSAPQVSSKYISKFLRGNFRSRSNYTRCHSLICPPFQYSFLSLNRGSHTSCPCSIFCFLATIKEHNDPIPFNQKGLENWFYLLKVYSSVVKNVFMHLLYLLPWLNIERCKVVWIRLIILEVDI